MGNTDTIKPIWQFSIQFSSLIMPLITFIWHLFKWNWGISNRVKCIQFTWSCMCVHKVDLVLHFWNFIEERPTMYVKDKTQINLFKYISVSIYTSITHHISNNSNTIWLHYLTKTIILQRRWLRANKKMYSIYICNTKWTQGSMMILPI